MKIIIIDNYDSFTYNLYQYVAEIADCNPFVFLNDKINYEEIEKIKPNAIIISPGPGNPANEKDFGVSEIVLQQTEVPTLGVCLGHQGIGLLAGGYLTEATEIVHGKASEIYHSGEDIFTNMPQGFNAIRYHSLMIEKETFPPSLEKIAWTTDDSIMAVKHKMRPFWGVQFHPESIGTEYGKDLLRNFITLARAYKK